MMKRWTSVVVLLLGCSLALAQAKKAAPADPWVGNWKLDLHKSKFPGPAPKAETLTVDAANADAVKYSTKGTGPDGAPYTESYDGKPDGQDYPLMRNGQEVAKISYHRDSDYESTGKATLGDGTTMTQTVTVSKDGKTLTVKQQRAGTEGTAAEVDVFHKI
jgi:hypothetical protein